MENLTLDILNQKECQDVIDSSLRIMEEVGCEVGNTETRNLLENAGCHVEDTKVFIPSSVVARALETAPKTVIVYDQEGNEALSLNARDGGSYVVSGVMNIARLDFKTGEKHTTTQKDAFDAGRIIDALPHIDVATGLCFISECDPTIANLYELRALLETTTKPKLIMSGDVAELKAQVEMCALAAGGLDHFLEKPFIISGAPSTPPLTHADDVLERVLYMYEMGLPAPYISSPMIGVSAPASIVGACTIGIAESLTGLVLSQAIKRGTPFIGSCFVDGMDMKSMGFTQTCPEIMLGAAAAGSIYRHLNLPYAVHLGCTDSPTLDAQAAADISAQLLIGLLSGANLIYFSGYLEAAMSSSLEALVFCDEVISMVKQFCKGVAVTQETLAEETTAEVGPGGTFLMTDHTLKNYRDLWVPQTFIREDFKTWKENGGKDYYARAHDKVTEILEGGKKEILSEDILAQLDAIIAKNQN